MKLIDKDAVVAKIESERKYYLDKEEYDFGWNNALDKILFLLDTIEVKDVDFDREIRRYRMGNPIIQHREESLYDYMANIAKHFFELGLKAQKGE